MCQRKHIFLSLFSLLNIPACNVSCFLDELRKNTREPFCCFKFRHISGNFLALIIKCFFLQPSQFNSEQRKCRSNCRLSPSRNVDRVNCCSVFCESTTFLASVMCPFHGCFSVIAEPKTSSIADLIFPSEVKPGSMVATIIPLSFSSFQNSTCLMAARNPNLHFPS